MVATLILLSVAAVLVLRSKPVTSSAGLRVVVWAPYIALLGVLGAAVAVTRCHAIAAIGAAALAAVGVGVQVSWYCLGRPPDAPDGIVMRVLASNIRNGQADPASLARLAEGSADVVMIAELTPEAAQRFSDAGIDRTFPHSSLITAPLAGGVGLWSRYPLTPLSLSEHPAAKIPAARVELPGIRFKPVIASVHIKSPIAGGRDSVEDWRTGLDFVGSQMQRFATIAGAAAVIVAGDFNSTPDIRQFRDLLTNGYRDAVQQTGAGFNPTFPGDRWYPPLITIDHVLVRGAVVSGIRTVRVAGSDHRGLLADVRIPANPDSG